MTFRPLLAATIKSKSDLDRLAYPMIASPKLDGIRTLIHPTLGPVTRKLKAIPNIPTRRYLSRPEFHYLDGEIVVGKEFSDTTSAIMSHSGTPNFTYFIFDSFANSSLPYIERLQSLKSIDSKVVILEHSIVTNPDEVLTLEAKYLEAGHEGLMLRSPSGQYKHNRSTFNEQILLKLKNFIDADAEIIGFEELYKNDNPLESNGLGYAERSTLQSGFVGMNTLGALLVRSEGFDLSFKIGSGYDQATRAAIWANQDRMMGKTIKFKYQDIGMKDRPRFPIFLAFRED